MRDSAGGLTWFCCSNSLLTGCSQNRELVCVMFSLRLTDIFDMEISCFSFKLFTVYLLSFHSSTLGTAGVC